MSEFSVRDLRDFYDPDEPNDSHFFITVNSNKTVHDGNQYQNWRDITKLTVNDTFGNRTGLEKVIKFIDNKKPPNEIDGDMDSIITSTVEYADEIGPIMGRYHVHIYLKIKHTSRILMNKEKIKEIFKFAWQIFGVENPYVNIKALYSEKNLRDYMGKDLMEFLFR